MNTGKVRALLLQILDNAQQVTQRTSQTVELPDNEYVTFAELAERFIQSRPLSFGTADSAIAKNLLAACRLQCVGLQV